MIQKMFQPLRPFPDIHEAAFYGDVRQLKEAIAQGQRTTKWSKMGLTAFHVASANGHLVFLQILHKIDGHNIDERDETGLTALHHAARNGHLDTLRWLIEQGADYKLKTHKGHVALDVAMANTDRQGQRAIVTFLKNCDRQKMAWEKE